MEHFRFRRQLGWLAATLSFTLLLVAVHAGQIPQLSQFQDQESSDIYSEGSLEVDVFHVAASPGLSALQEDREGRRHGLNLGKMGLGTNRPPLPLLVAAPTEAGNYSVIQFQHGFLLSNTFYSQMLKHIASHGFIVVAPQMYNFYLSTDCTEEICHAADLLDWLPTGLSDVLSQHVGASVVPDLSKLALVGHSRGGKVAFGLATKVCESSVKYSAIVGIDPVDGTSSTSQSLPKILYFSAHDLNLTIPTLIVGTGLGPVPKSWFIGACAPDGVNHAEYFYESQGPAYHFVASDYGHMDMLDDSLSWIGEFESSLCSNGPSKDPMRRFTAGVVVAFLKAAVLDDDSSLSSAIKDVSSAPVKVDTPEVYS